MRPSQVYGMAVICLAVGLTLGYFFRSSQLQPTPAQIAANSALGSSAQRAIPGPAQSAGAPAQSPHPGAMGGKAPTLQDMKQMADSKAAPLLAKLKTDPNNTSLLDQVGAVYHATHQFNEAAAYYGKAVQIDPKSVPLRTKLAISLYRSGDVDGAIAQLNRALSLDPKDANALFDLGMIRLQANQDSKGALAAWQQLLNSNPQLTPDRKATVQKLIASVQNAKAGQPASEGVQTK